MGCLCSCFGKCDPCCRRIGCSCADHDSEGYLASIDKNRSCTDVPCLALFAAFILFLVSYVWADAFSNGDPDRIIRGVNHAGMVCGTTEGVTHLPYAFWPDPTQFRFKVCTDDCNQATSEDWDSNHIIVSGAHTPGGYPSETYIDKYCIPTADAGVTISGFDSYSNEFQRQMGDIKTAMPVIGASIAIAFVASFAYIWLMKCCVGLLVWATISLIIFGGFLLGYLVFDASKDEQLSETEANVREYGSYIIFGLTAVFALIIVFARTRIRIAIQVIKSASRSLGDLPMMVFFPIMPTAVVVAFFIVWVYSSVYIFSAGQSKAADTPDEFEGLSFAAEGGAYTTEATFEVIDYDHTIQNQFAPHFFLLLWVAQICVYFTFTVIAGSVSDWYFTKRDEGGHKLRGSEEGQLSKRAVLDSCARTVRYHMGTVIFAALVIAIIQFLRWCVRYVERTLNASGKEPNKVQKVLFKFVDCLLGCLECCLDKISRNALIWCSIYGDAFCPAVCGSFKLIWANLVRVAVITFFSTIVTFLGKVMVPCMTTAVCAAILLFVSPYSDELSSPVLPLLIIFIISVSVSMLFLTVYDTAIDTVFLCFLIDEKQNKNSGKPMFADDGLRSIVQKYEAESKELAQSVQRHSTRQNNDNYADKAADEEVQI